MMNHLSLMARVCQSFLLLFISYTVMAQPATSRSQYKSTEGPTPKEELTSSGAPSADDSFTLANSGNSDYRVTWSWAYNSSYCNCSQTTTLSLTWTQAGGPPSPSFSVGAGTHEHAVGPSVTLSSFDYSFNYSGRRSWTGDGCTIFATCNAGVDCGCNYTFSGDASPSTISTAAVKPPTGVTATDADFDTKVDITWSKGTDIPTTKFNYRIYRDNVYIGTRTGSQTSFTDGGRQPGETHTYAVTTYVPASSFGQIHESSKTASGAHDQGSTFDPAVTASDGDYYNRTKVTWNSLADVADDIRVERSIPDSLGLEELAIVNPNATSYSDQGGIPGYTYTYYVTPLAEGQSFLTDDDTGFSRPNGVIKGHVKSKLAAGVSGVDVNVELLTTIPAGGATLPTCVQEYCATTDASGYYEIKDIYYYDGADFRIYPVKGGIVPHEFLPDTLFRTLDENGKTASGVDFTDLTVFTVAGTVTYPQSSNGSTCGVQGATVLIDGDNFGIVTDSDGDWSFAIQDEDTYTFTVEYFHHSFEDPLGQAATTVVINADNVDLDFENVETEDLQIVVQGGCHASLGDSVEIQITAPGNCFNETHYTDVNGLLTLSNLPARDYSVQVTDIYDIGNPNISNIMAQIGNIPVVIDLTIRDTAETISETEVITIIEADTLVLPNDSIIITAADTIIETVIDTSSGEVEPNVQFTYRSPLDISIDFTDAGAVVTDCDNSEGEKIILMEQGVSYVLSIVVQETLGMECYIDTGFLKIYDFISDREGAARRVPIIGGVATYVIDAGEPQVASNPTFHNHEKLLYIVPEVDFIDPVGVEYWALVTGAKSNTSTFFTRTPEIPMIILHDPPGDNSYSYIEKGQSFTNFTTNEVLVGGDAGIFANLLLGAKVLTPFSGNGFGAIIKFSAEAGRDNFDRDGTFTTITFTERFSTSDADNLTGKDGDVYIGAAFNQEFSLAQYLTFNTDTCGANVDIVPSLDSEEFATTFVYTEKHIKNTLLPTIGFLKENILDGRDPATLSEEDITEVNNLIADSVSWTSILALNEANRNPDSNAVFQENVSFSAGAPISREYVNDTLTQTSYEYTRFVNSSFALGAKIDNESGVWFDSELGVMGNFRWSTTTNSGDDTTYTRTVGYELDDGDIGDFFSVDILQDVGYNVPAFDLKLGTTSCPQEEGSQARDRATIKILPPEINNVPSSGQANFIAQLTNTSESFETREYAVRVVSTTNPDGAAVRLGGQLINNGEASFFLEHNQTLNVNLSVTRGPLASNYENIGVMIYPPCEYELWQDNGDLINSDTAYIVRLNYESECTNVALSLPDDGWLVNQNSNNLIHATFTGYDLNNEKFEFVTLQMKREGEGYVDQITIDKANLIGPFYDIFFDVTNFEDGEYRMRAKAFCGATGGLTYSSEKKGIIDRSSLAPFGTPTPSDGFLREGQEISVTFDKLIDCAVGTYPTEISLTRNDTEAAIVFTTSCFENKLILTTNPPLTEIPDLEGVVVTARVNLLKDLNGNVQEYPTEWSFLVNVSPVFWDPEHLYVSGLEGQSHTMTGVLKNTSNLSKSFSLDEVDDPVLIDFPDWLTPMQTHGTVLPSNDFNVGFIVNADLTPGIYTGIVTAMVDSLPVSMDVTFELFAKPVTWSFDANGYEHSMNIVAQFSRNDSDTLLSTDSRDIIAAFVDGELRGLAKMEFIPSLNKHVAFLTVYSNSIQQNQDITFRFWYALNGIEYGAVETIEFEVDALEGAPDNPFLLHPLGVLQVIPLNIGWNWISFNVEDADMSRERVFESLLASGNEIIVKSQIKTTEYSGNTGWQGNLQDLELGQGYFVHLSDFVDTLKLVGFPSDHDIAKSVGTWTWIGFPRLNPEPVNSVLSDLNPTDGDVLKNQYGFSSYTNSQSSWIGNVSFFNPGEGYKLNVDNSGVITFGASRFNDYEVIASNFEYNMNVTGTFDPSLLGEHSHEDLLIGAFIDGECRGLVEAEYVQALDEYRYYLLVYSNRDDFLAPVTFKVINTISQAEYECNGDLVEFVPDALIGYSWNPYFFLSSTTPVVALYEDGYSLKQNQPNPAVHETTISYGLPKQDQVRISVYNVQGILVDVLLNEEINSGEHTITFSVADYPIGLYFYELKTPHVRLTKKMMIK